MEILGTWWFWTVYAIVGCFVWYAANFFEYGLNSGQLGHHPFLFPFQCFVEDLPCYLPFGKERRIAFIKERMSGSDHGSFLSDKAGYDYVEIREKNLYEEVFWSMMGGRMSYFGRHLLYSIGWPVTIILLLIVMLFGALIAGMMAGMRTAGIQRDS